MLNSASSQLQKLHARLGLSVCALLLLTVLAPVNLHAQDIAQVKKGVVKITAQVDGKTKVGSGFIVRLDKDAAYIVTASHVVEGDPQPKIIFHPNDKKVFVATIKGLQGGDPRGLAVLVVEGTLPEGIETLPLNQDFTVTGGESGTVIGFPRVPNVPWAVTSSIMTGQQGTYLVFSGAAVEGNSGGPIMVAGKVVGVVTEVVGQYGYAVPIQIMQIALRGWGVPLGMTQQRTTAQLMREITGKDGAPMVLISAGEFWLGSSPEELAEVVKACNASRHFDKRVDCEDVFRDELPRHRVSVDNFLLDKYEVTNERFERFSRETGYRTTAERNGNALTFVLGMGWKEVAGAYWLKPEGKESVFETRRDQHPVVSVSWADASAYCQWAEKRLPREAEWEYAARAGTVTQYWWGNRALEPYDVANLLEEDEEPVRATRGIKVGQWRDGYQQTSPVGALRKNPWGLYDMIGNVWEWVDDWYGASAYSTEQSRKQNGSSRGSEKVLRGGSWDNEPFVARVSTRGRESEDTRSPAIGFRCAQDAVNPALLEEHAGRDVLNATGTLRLALAYQCNAKPIAPLKRKPEVFVSQWRTAIESMKAERNIYDLQNLVEIWGRIPVSLTGEQLVAEARYTVDCLAASGTLETEATHKPGKYWGVKFDNILMKFKK